MGVSPLLRAFFLVRALRFRGLAVRPRADETIRIVGPDPIRVLVVGAGLAAAYGVRTHEQGLAGHLARRLADQSGRGVVVQTRTVPLMPASEAVRTIGPLGAHTFDAVVFAGCHLESRLPPGSAKDAHIEDVLDHLAETGPGHLVTVVAGLPQPSGRGRADRATAATVSLSNHRVKDAIEHHRRAIFVPTPAYSNVYDPNPFDSSYYQNVARSIVEDGLHHYDRWTKRRGSADAGD